MACYSLKRSEMWMFLFAFFVAHSHQSVFAVEVSQNEPIRTGFATDGTIHSAPKCSTGCDCISRVYPKLLQCFHLNAFPWSGNMASVEILSIQMSDLEYLGPDQFRNLSKLRCLELVYTRIGTIMPGTFKIMRHLNELTFDHIYLNSNQVKSVICELGYRQSTPRVVTSPVPFREACRVITDRKGFRLSIKHDYFLSSDRGKPTDTFSCLGSSGIISLNLSASSLNWATTQNILCNTQSIQDLSLREVYSYKTVTIPDGLFTCMNNSDLQILDLSNNFLNTLGMESFQGLTSVKALLLYHAFRMTILDFVLFRHMANLEYLDLRSNELTTLSSYSSSYSYPDVLPKLKCLLIGENKFTALAPFVQGYLPQLQFLSIANNMDVISFKEVHFLGNLPNLRELDLHGSRFTYFPSKLFLSNTLRYIDLEQVEVSVLYRNNHSEFMRAAFQLAPQLTYLSMKGFRLENFDRTQTFSDKAMTYWELLFSLAYQNLSNVTNLDLSDIGLRVVYTDNFLNSNSVSNLDLSGNRIKTIEAGAFDKLVHMKYLILDHNEIAIVDENMFPPAIIMNVQTLYLDGNPFACVCDNYWLRHFIKRTNIKLSAVDRDDYICASPPYLSGTLFEDYNPTWDECYFTAIHRNYYIILGVASSFLFVLLTLTILFRARWHLHYCYVSLRARRKHYNQLQDDEYQFDAFVAYAYSDTNWVLSELAGRLEAEYKCHLCLHDRDWAVGKDIADNIVQSIEHSRKVVLVISNAFAQSHWCRMELTMAQHKLFSEDKDNLVLIMKEEIHSCYMTPQLALQMRIKTFIKWTEDEMGQEVFWKRLVRALKKPNKSIGMTEPQEEMTVL